MISTTVRMLEKSIKSFRQKSDHSEAMVLKEIWKEDNGSTRESILVRPNLLINQSQRELTEEREGNISEKTTIRKWE